MKERIFYLDGLRGFAALWIAFFHFPFFSFAPIFLNYGYLGVDIFSLLSGFLVYYNFILKNQGILEFLTIRFIRIFSLFIPFILIIKFITFLIIQTNFTNLSFLINLLVNKETMPAWSLKNELILYLISPVLYFFFSKKNWRYTEYFLPVLITLFLLWFFGFVQKLPFNNTENQGGFLRFSGIDIHTAKGYLLKFIDGSGFERMFFEYLLGIFAAKYYLVNDEQKISFSSSFIAFFKIFIPVSLTLLWLTGNINACDTIPKLQPSAFCNPKLLSLNKGHVYGDIYIVLTIFFLMTFSNIKTILHYLFESKIMLFFGKISYSMYVVHVSIIKIFRFIDAEIYSFENVSIIVLFGFYLACITLFSMILNYLFEQKFYLFLKTHSLIFLNQIKKESRKDKLI